MDILKAIIFGKKPVKQKLYELKNYDFSNLDANNLEDLLLQIDSSILQREFVSQIGKTRQIKFQPFLVKALNHQDPKVVIQVLRALNAFKDPQILSNLKKLQTHPNELVKNYANSLFAEKTAPKLKNTPKIMVDKRLQNVAVCGDTLEIMRLIDDNCVQLTFTSPPYYNARDYSIYKSYVDYLAFLAQVFVQIHRITAEGRFFVINTSPIIMPRASRSSSSKRYPIPFDIHPLIESAGFEFIDDILWVKPKASVKNRNGGFMQHRKPLGYKPNLVTEYVMVYRKKTNKLIDWNMRQYDFQTIEQSKVLGDYETSNVWQIDPVSTKEHSAVFPQELCKRVIEFYSYVGDLVFDPFAGSGTVGLVSQNTKRNFLLTELNEDYFKLIKSKISGLFQPNIQFLTLEEFKKLW